MRRFFTTSLIALTLFVGVVGVAPSAHADDIECTLNNSGSACAVDGVSGICSGDENSGPYCRVTGTSDATSFSGLTDAQRQAAANTTTNPTLGGDTASQFGKIMTWIMSLFAWLVGVAALLLNYAVYYTVVTMGDFVHNLSAVGVTWRILRDIGNIMLIFGFLCVGITTILNVDWYGFTTKMLPMLLLSAVFLNFSLFLTEAIVDTGNLFATQFYKQINGGVMPTRESLSNVTVGTWGSGNLGNEGISNKIMGQLGLQTLYNANVKSLEAGNTWLIGFLGIILFLITAFVLFSLAFVLIARFVILLFLIIVSPIGWAALAIPKLRNVSDRWWSELAEQTITAPVLLLCLYIALAVITDAQFLTGLCTPDTPGGACTKHWLGFVSGNSYAGFASMILSFLVAMGLLLAVVVISKKLSAFGGDLATKFAGKLTFGATAWAAQRTVGRGAYYASRGLRQNKLFNAINARTGRVLSGTLDRAATGSFDVRASTAFKSIPFGGVAAGEANKGGFTEARKQNIKEHEAEAKRIEEAHREALKNTPKDEAAIAKAEKARKDAEDAKTNARKEKSSAETAKREAEAKHARDKAEVERLAAIDKSDRAAGRSSSVGEALRAAQEKLKTSEGNLGAATANLDKAAAALTKAIEDETSAEKAKAIAEGAAESRMKESIRENKIAYAEGIKNPINPINFIAYGPNSAAAARNIIKDAKKKKSTNEQLTELMKKAIKEEEEKEKAAASGGTTEPPKPATTAPPAAPHKS